MTFVIITAGIDLSVGAVLGLSSVVTATMMISGGFGLIPTLLAVLVAGHRLRRRSRRDLDPFPA